MAKNLALRIGSVEALARYVALQLEHLFPCGDLEEVREALLSCLPGALERIRPILEAVRNFTPGLFDHFHTLQYSTLLYLLANEHWRTKGGGQLADRLNALNRALNSIDLFYAVRLPEVFFLSHALGTVLGNADYGDRVVVFQNVTVGRVGDARPRLGANVVLYPGSHVTGAAQIGDDSVIGAGVVIHGGVVAPDSVVLRDSDGRQVIRERRKNYSELYFRPGGR